MFQKPHVEAIQKGPFEASGLCYLLYNEESTNQVLDWKSQQLSPPPLVEKKKKEFYVSEHRTALEKERVLFVWVQDSLGCKATVTS